VRYSKEHKQATRQRIIEAASTTGGTDVVCAFAGFVPTEPVWAGELSVPCLGVALEAWDPDGRPVVFSCRSFPLAKPARRLRHECRLNLAPRWQSALFDLAGTALIAISTFLAQHQWYGRSGSELLVSDDRE
jgi:hypothetical protein